MVNTIKYIWDGKHNDQYQGWYKKWSAPTMIKKTQ